MFRALCAHRQEVNRASGIITLCRRSSRIQVEKGLYFIGINLITCSAGRSPGTENIFVPAWRTKENIFNYLNFEKIRRFSRSRSVTGTRSIWGSTPNMELHAARGPLFTDLRLLDRFVQHAWRVTLTPITSSKGELILFLRDNLFSICRWGESHLRWQIVIADEL